MVAVSGAELSQLRVSVPPRQKNVSRSDSAPDGDAQGPNRSLIVMGTIATTEPTTDYLRLRRARALGSLGLYSNTRKRLIHVQVIVLFAVRAKAGDIVGRHETPNRRVEALLFELEPTEHAIEPDDE